MLNKAKRRQVAVLKVDSLQRRLDGLRAQHASAAKEFDSFMSSYVAAPRPPRPAGVSPYLYDSEMFDRIDPGENEKIGRAAELYQLEADIAKTEKHLEKAQVKVIRLS